MMADCGYMFQRTYDCYRDGASGWGKDCYYYLVTEAFLRTKKEKHQIENGVAMT